MKPNITLLINNIPFIFVIPPIDYTVTTSNNIGSYNILNKGEEKGKGVPNCRKISWSGFFPSVNSNLYNILNPLPSLACKEALLFAKDNDVQCQLLIPEWGEYLKVKIESFDYNYSDHTGDIDYRITLVEDRKTASNLVDMVTGLFSR